MGERLWFVSSADADFETTLGQVLTLSKRNAKTLGFLTNEAFTDRVETGQLVVASTDDEVSGFVLFDLPRTGKITLRQVCVNKDMRGSGVAKRMVDMIIDRFPDKIELAADCREDYKLEGFWHALGMTPQGERPGRRQLGSVLTRWRRPLGSLDLFEANFISSPRPLAVLDSNVISDLYSARHVVRDRALESQGLLQPWLADHLNFAVSRQVDTEIQRVADVIQRQALRAGSQSHPRIRTTRPDDESLEDELRERLAPRIGADNSLSEDLLHLADAIRAEASYFVTNDDALLGATSDWLLSEHGVEAVRPHVLVNRTRSHVGQPSFLPRLIESVELTWTDIDGHSEVDIQNAFTNHNARERGKALLQRIANHRVGERAHAKVLQHGSEAWALLLFSVDQAARTLVVPVIRVRAGEQALTLALQLTRYLRRLATADGLNRIEVFDPSVPSAVDAALREDGYTQYGPRWVAEPRAGYDSASGLDLEQTVARERRHWPLALIDSSIPCAVVPIQPNYAENLLGFTGDTLFQMRRTALGILRQHVYVHAAGGPQLEVPSRLLWYVTADGLSRRRSIVARSRLIASDTLPADDAHEVYGQLSVLKRSAMRDVANKRGNVHVVRFEDTELLETEVDRRGVELLKRRHEIRGNFQTIRRVPAAFFDDVIRMQHDEEP